MINICLVGCGRMGRAHAKHIDHSPFAKLYCVVDVNQEAAKALSGQYSAKNYLYAEEAFQDSSVDAVVIVSSTATHTDLISAAAKARKPIFCEKPIDLDLNKTDACLKIVKKYGVPLFVAFNRRFDPTFRLLKNKLAAGEIGRIEMLSISSRDAPVPALEYLRTSGGMFRDMTIHDFDMARWLLQEEPTEVYASGSCLIDPRIKEFNDIDTAMITLKTASGAICQINNSRRSIYGYDQRIEAFGPKGMLRANNVPPTSLEITSEGGVRTDNPLPSFPERYVDAYRIELDHFFNDVVIQGKEPEVSGKDGRQAMVIAEAADLSLRSGVPVKIS